MPSYTTPVTATAGQPLAAADWNAGVRDNLTILGGAWTAYTPTWSSTGTAPAIGNGTVAGHYRLMGKTLDLRVSITMGTTTTYGAIVWTVGLPAGLTAATSGDQLLQATYTNTGVATYLGSAALAAASSTLVPTVYTGTAGGGVALPTGTVPFSWGTGDVLSIQGTVEVA